MKKILIIKTSSLGDVIHTLPALTDAKKALGDVQFDWVVEENFAEIPAWHPEVKTIIPVAIRRWRKHIIKTLVSGEWKRFKQQLQQEQYDYVIDAQGLLKSALITRLAHGKSYGLDNNSARESMASRFYQCPQTIDKQQHAVERIRQLFAKVLGYELDGLSLDYGIKKGIKKAIKEGIRKDISEGVEDHHAKILFLHGTTWETKHWPETYWFKLAEELIGQDCSIVLPWGDDSEYQRALRIKKQCKENVHVLVLNKMSLNELVKTIMTVDAVVAVDTGLAHLSAALDKPTVALYGPTSPGLTGTYGNNQLHLKAELSCAPCFKKKCDKTDALIAPECFGKLNPQQVIESLNQLLRASDINN